MKIKLAILENDTNYLNRIVSVFSTKYADKIQIYSFTDLQIAISALGTEKIDVFIANDFFSIDVDELPKRCCFAYFVDNTDIETVGGQRAICKFQKAELIYKQILSIYSENAGNLAGLKLTDDESKIIIFSSPCGGNGTSSMAAGCALHFAQKGKRVLFLSFEDFGSSDLYFSGEGQFDMSDVIFALKSKKSNVAMKLESYVKIDPSGVYFFSKAKFALDMLELSHEERIQLLTYVKMFGSYDYVVLDCAFGLDNKHIEYFKKAHNIVMVSDGSNISNMKITNAFVSLLNIDQTLDASVVNRFSLVYNKFSSKTGSMLENVDLKSIGGAPIFLQANEQQIVEELSKLDLFEKLA